MKKVLFLFALVGSFLIANDSYAQKYTHNQTKTGTASYYHEKFVGRPTSTGETFRNTGYTAASNFFKLNTYVKVTNIKNGKVVYVKINDRMGHPTRVLDLTKRAAKDLGYMNAGLTKVKIEVVDKAEGKRKILAQKEGATFDENTL